MAKRKTTELTTITAAALADGDWFPVVDVSDTTDSSTGTNKKIAKSELAEAAGLAAHLADTSDAPRNFLRVSSCSAVIVMCETPW